MPCSAESSVSRRSPTPSSLRSALQGVGRCLHRSFAAAFCAARYDDDIPAAVPETFPAAVSGSDRFSTQVGSHQAPCSSFSLLTCFPAAWVMLGNFAPAAQKFRDEQRRGSSSAATGAGGEAAETTAGGASQAPCRPGFLQAPPLRRQGLSLLGKAEVAQHPFLVAPVLLHLHPACGFTRHCRKSSSSCRAAEAMF